MDQILLIGEQPSLLATRAESLAETGARVTCCDMNQLNVFKWDESFDLVILCHTLLGSGVRRSCLIADIYRYWPQADILQVVRGYGDQGAETGVDASLMVRKPNELAAVTMRLLGRPPQEEQWLSLSQYTAYAA